MPRKLTSFRLHQVTLDDIEHLKTLPYWWSGTATDIVTVAIMEMNEKYSKLQQEKEKPDNCTYKDQER